MRYSNPRFSGRFPEDSLASSGQAATSFPQKAGRPGKWRDWFDQFLPPYVRQVGTEALHRDDHATLLFELLSDACQALPIGDRRSDLGPKGANQASDDPDQLSATCPTLCISGEIASRSGLVIPFEVEGDHAKANIPVDCRRRGTAPIDDETPRLCQPECFPQNGD
jgi:hypothetical protein